MKLHEKRVQYSMGAKFFNGRYRGCKCVISYSCEDKENPYWYFVCDNEEDTIRHNSLWESLKYKSKEDCHDACVKYIDRQIEKLVAKDDD